MSTHSDSPSSSSSPSEVIHPDQMMDWKEWEGHMAKIQSHGLTRFLKRYVDTKRMDIKKFLVNLELTIAIAFNEQSSDEDQAPNLHKIQALVTLENSILKFLKTRRKLPEYNTIDDAVSLIQRAQNIVILTGAGISTSSGIPDFRSENGLYAQLENYEGLDDPHDMFDLRFFKSNPLPFYKFLMTIFPFSSTTTSSTITNGPKKRSASSPVAKTINPSDSHRFIKLVESNSKLLRNYTQNIDTLETRAGVKNLIQCHGSFAKFTCLKCRAKYPASQFEDLIAQGQVILCPTCDKLKTMEASKPTSKKRRKMDVYKFDDASSGDDGPDMDWVELGLMKPDITFFGEDLPDEFDEAIEKDRLVCDLMIVIGTSLKIAPVSEIIKFVPAEVPQIFINRDPIYHGKRKTSRAPGEGQFEYEGDEFEFDICLFGQSDLILRELARRLGPAWPLDHTANLAGASPPQSGSLSDALPGPNELKQDTLASKEKQAIPFTPFGKHINHIWFFPGANTSHSWFERWRILEQAGANPHGDAQELSSSDEFHSPQLTKKEILSPAREDEAAKEKLEGSNTSDQQVQGAEPSKHLDISDHNARRVDYPSIEKAGGVAPVDLPGSKQADLKSEAVDTSKVKEIGPSIQQSLPQE